MTHCASTTHRLLDALEGGPGAAHRMSFVDDAGQETSIDYHGFAEAVLRHAGALRELGIRENDIVMLALPASVEHAVAMMACVMAGALPCTVPVPAKRSGEGRQVAEVACELYRPRLAIGLDALAPVWQAAPVVSAGTRVIDAASFAAAAEAGAQPFISAKSGNDPHHVQLTSGSTSHPKAAVLSHANVIANVLGIGGAVLFDIEQGDGTVSWLPLYHDMGLLTLLSNLHYRAPLLFMQPNSFIRNPLGWLKRIAATRATTTSVPTFALRYCVRRFNAAAMEGVDLSACRNIFIGGERVDADTLRDFATTFAPHGLDASALQPCYGMAESTLAVSMHRAWHAGRIEGAPYVIADAIDKRALIERRAAEPVAPAEADAPAPERELVLAMGKPIPGMRYEIVDEHGATLAERQAGEIAIRGSSLMLGYLDAGSGEIVAPLTPNGAFLTGDIGYVADEQLYILGRKKEVIIIRGSNYFPHEIEDALSAHPLLRKSTCIAFGCPDTASGTERLVVAIETRPVDASAQTRLECQQLLGARIGFAAQDLCFVEPGSLPRTTSGKLQRLKCRELYTQGALSLVAAPAAAAGKPALQGALA